MTLVAPYGETGRSGAVSATGSCVASPYTLDDDA
jgi:hypothetical protein